MEMPTGICAKLMPAWPALAAFATWPWGRRSTSSRQQAAGSASVCVCVAAWLRGLAAVAVAFASGHSPLRAFALLWLIYGHAHKSGWPAWADYKQSGGEGRGDGGNREEDEDSARISVSALLSVTHAQSKRECKNKSALATHCGVADDEIPFTT